MLKVIHNAIDLFIKLCYNKNIKELPMFLLDQWKKVLNKLENEVTVITFDLWINTLTPIQYANDELILLAPSVNAKIKQSNLAFLKR